jgi:hypothetical protein
MGTGQTETNVTTREAHPAGTPVVLEARSKGGLFGEESAYLRHTNAEIAQRLRVKFCEFTESAGAALNPARIIERWPIVSASAAAAAGFALAQRIAPSHAKAAKTRAAPVRVVPLLAKAISVGLEALETYFVTRRTKPKTSSSETPPHIHGVTDFGDIIH